METGARKRGRGKDEEKQGEEEREESEKKGEEEKEGVEAREAPPTLLSDCLGWMCLWTSDMYYETKGRGELVDGSGGGGD